MALAIPEYQFEDVDRYLRQRRAAGKPVTDRDYRGAWDQYWNAQIGRQLEARRLGLMEQRVGLMDRQTDLMEKRYKDEADAEKMRGYFEGLGTLFQGIMVGGYGREKGWW